MSRWRRVNARVDPMQRILVLSEGVLQCQLNLSGFISYAFKLRENASVLCRVVNESRNYQVARLAEVERVLPTGLSS